MSHPTKNRKSPTVRVATDVPREVYEKLLAEAKAHGKFFMKFLAEVLAARVSGRGE